MSNRILQRGPTSEKDSDGFHGWPCSKDLKHLSAKMKILMQCPIAFGFGVAVPWPRTCMTEMDTKRFALAALSSGQGAKRPYVDSSIRRLTA